MNQSEWAVQVSVASSQRPFREKRTMSMITKSRICIAGIGGLVCALALSTVNLVTAAETRSANDYFLSTGPGYELYGDSSHKYVSETFTLVNGNNRSILIRKIGQNGPGLQLLVPSGSGKSQKLVSPSGMGKTRTVSAHKSIRLTVWYHVSQCSKVPKGVWPLTMDVAWHASKWQRVSLQMPSDPAAPWPRYLTDLVCL